jgi:hypothetical protein
MRPVTASDGIQETDVTLLCTRTRTSREHAGMVIQEFTGEAIARATTIPSAIAMALGLAVSWGTMFVHDMASLPISPWAI